LAGIAQRQEFVSPSISTASFSNIGSIAINIFPIVSVGAAFKK